MSFGSKEPSAARGASNLPSGPVGIQRESEALNKAGDYDGAIAKFQRQSRVAIQGVGSSG
jgi:hypothetical protein